MKIKFAICPGPVESQVGGETYYITADQLIKLYRVPRGECIIIDNNDKWHLEGRRGDGLIWLYPKHSGNYTQPKPKNHHVKRGLK